MSVAARSSDLRSVQAGFNKGNITAVSIVVGYVQAEIQTRGKWRLNTMRPGI